LPEKCPEVEAAQQGITPLEALLRTMRKLWAKAHEASLPDLDLAKQACAIAAQAAPYCHPRLAAIETKVDTTGQVEVKLTRAELDERAQRIIDETFREYRPPGHEEERASGAVIEPRRSPDEGGDRSEPVADADPPAPRDFVRPSVPSMAGLPSRRRPRPVGSGWAG
jgi:hypothetical protein